MIGLDRNTVNSVDDIQKKRKIKKFLLTVLLTAVWYSSAFIKALLTKYILNRFGYPLTLVMNKFLAISIYLVPILYLSKLKFNCFSKYYIFRFVLPISVLLVISTSLGYVALWKVTVSYQQIIRATQPIFTVVLIRILFHTVYRVRVYLSLIPIVVGVSIATFTESSFNLVGMLCGVAATSMISIENILNKKVMKDAKVHSFQLQAYLIWFSTLLYLPFWFTIDGLQFINNPEEIFGENWLEILGLLMADGLVNVFQSVTAFNVLYLITPTSYAVLSISKRPFVVVFSIILFQNLVTVWNGVGIFVALVGGALYTYFRFTEEKVKKVDDTPTIIHISNISTE